MRKRLSISLGQCTSKGRKELNQDSIGACISREPLLSTKGIAIAVADGISSSSVSQVASETAVNSFLQDYFCTSEAWSVKKSAEQVLQATNSWLHSQTHNSPYRYNKDKGYVCTFSAIILKSNTAHLFHCGDTRIYRLAGCDLEQLTQDHCHHHDSSTRYLTRALGIHPYLELDYRALSIEEGDVFLLASDGVYEFVTAEFVANAIAQYRGDLNRAAKAIVQCALDAHSDDNLSVQIIRVEQLPDHQVDEIYDQISSLPLPPRLQVRMEFDGYRIEREIYISSRSHVFLAHDLETNQSVVIKTPSTEMRSNKAYLERFLMEDWIAKRLDNVHLLKAITPSRKKHYLYLVSEYLEGQTLAQWMLDNPRPSLESVRNIIEQIAKGLQAFHRQEMVHQDLRPNNIMIDGNGTVKIIDFGSTKVAGVAEVKRENGIQGTAQYTAPEYFVDGDGDARSDLFSLGVMCYHLLTGQLPYGTQVAAQAAKAFSASGQKRLQYCSMLSIRKDIPMWVDEAVKKAVHVIPVKRYGVLSEFVYDLRFPNQAFINKSRPPLMERHPVVFWQCVSAVLLLLVLILIARNGVE